MRKIKWLHWGIPLLLLTVPSSGHTQVMEKMWDTSSVQHQNPNVQWFKAAKFGLFIHWGLYSKLGGVWKGKRYYGSGEWIMNQAKIPAKQYAKIADHFNPIDFNADAWAKLAKDAGAKYLVITAKHHEGFAMFDSKVSPFNIVQATPYKKDPMKALSEAVRKQGIRFGFYYSQFVDWHEPNGGGNTWDFDKNKKDYKLYYREKSIPQLKELLTHYGPLGLVWFDLPGGLTKKETKALVDSLHQLQPKSLFSSRVGQGEGDYKDFGDSEIPETPIDGPWEAIFTNNDTWGYIANDKDFKSPKQIIQLLANVASKGGNLMLNVGPDGNGDIPPYAVKYLEQTGKWLQKYGQSIYGSSYGFVPAQPWGVTTAKPGKLFLQVFQNPKDGRLLIPGFNNKVLKAYELNSHQMMHFEQKGSDLIVQTGHFPTDGINTVYVIAFKGKAPGYPAAFPITVSSQFDNNKISVIHANAFGNAHIQSLTYMHYFGDWKHTSCATQMKEPADSIRFHLRIIQPGDYKIVLEYNCPATSAGQEGNVLFNKQRYWFKTLRTGEFDSKHPLTCIEHTIAVTTIDKTGVYDLTIAPAQAGNELFKLQDVQLIPVANIE